MNIITNASEVAFNLQAELLAAQSELAAERLRADTAVADANDAERQLAALREELAKAESDNDTIAEHNIELQQRLTAAEQRNAELQKDKDRLDALEANFWDIRHGSHPIADTGDSSSSLEIIGHWMDKPFERVIGENYNEDIRAAIDQAMTAPAYPPERPEYPEFDDLAQPTESGASE